MPLSQVSAVTSTLLLTLSLSVCPAWATDPFRSSNNAREIGENTEAAFRSMFEQGNYQNAQWYLLQAESTEANEPMVHALLASFSYRQNDWEGLQSYTSKTMAAAQALRRTDPLRGNLYIAIAHFLEGAHILATKGTLKGASQALNKLQDVFRYMDAAQQVDPDDPELNLIRGYMDLLLALNLPFSDPQAAINKLEKYASPSYLADRGLAVAYRDLNQPEKALEFVNQAIVETPNNPEILYLKAQILTLIGKKNNDGSLFKEAKDNFQAALEQPQKLPNQVVAQIFYEQCKNLNRIDNQSRSCDPLRDTIRDTGNLWGPVQDQMPSL